MIQADVILMEKLRLMEDWSMLFSKVLISIMFSTGKLLQHLHHLQELSRCQIHNPMIRIFATTMETKMGLQTVT